MAPITKLTRKTKTFLWSKGLGVDQTKVIESPILISPNWKVEFHIHTYASLLTVRMSHNVTRKCDQPIVYTSRLLNKAKHKHNKKRGFNNDFCFTRIQTLLFGQ
jgi:hypothetical protein